MFSNPLKQAAEEYLYTSDEAVRERTKQQLVRAGPSAVAPLVNALIVTFRRLNSASWGKSELQSFADATAEFLGPYADQLRQQLNDMPDSGDGMSMAQVMFSREACSNAWQVILQFGEQGIRALFNVINGRDKRLCLAALLALSAEENPSRFILNLLMTSAPAQENFSDKPIESMTQTLVLRTLGLSGDSKAREMIVEFARGNNITEGEFYEGAVNQSIYLLAKSR